MVNGEGSVRLRSSRLMGTPAPPPLKIEVLYVEKGSDAAWQNVLYQAGLANGERHARATTTATDHHRLLHYQQSVCYSDSLQSLPAK